MNSVDSNSCSYTGYSSKPSVQYPPGAGCASATLSSCIPIASVSFPPQYPSAPPDDWQSLTVSLFERLEVLEKRLDPVLMPSGPIACPPAAMESRVIVELKALNARLCGILARIQF